MNRLTGLMVAVFLLSAAVVHAGRPLNTDDAGTVAVKELEMEAGYAFSHSAADEQAISAAFTTGLARNLDFGFELPAVFVDPEGGRREEGIGDASVGLKWGVLKEHDYLPDAALGFSYKSDSGDDGRGLGTGQPEYALNGIFTKAFEHVMFHVNTGYVFKKDATDADIEDVLTYGIAAEWAVDTRLSLVAEFFGDNTLNSSFNDNAASVLAGFSYRFSDALAFDLGVTAGVSDAAPDWQLATGLTYAWGFIP